MNIRIPHSWLTDYVSPKLSPYDIARRVSQSGPSIDRIYDENGDTIYDVEITTNRPDAYAVYGFSREVAAILNVPFHERFIQKHIQKQKEKHRFSGSAQFRLDIDIQHSSLCRRYCGIIMDNVRNGKSPEWMQKRLIACGLRPISAVVDITNYVMLEYGQPLHAFDAEKVISHQTANTRGTYKKIVIRNARKQESAVTLDNEKKILDPSVLVIADDTQVLALAGIKGCRGAEISDTTKTIILEAASFDPVNIRASSRALNIRTDSSARFEKNLSSEYPLPALFRMIELLKEYTDAHVATPVNDAYPIREHAVTIAFDTSLLKRILGVSVQVRDIKRILALLGFSVQIKGKDINVGVPFWRGADVRGSIDLVEEIGRMVGYHTFSPQALRGETPYSPLDQTYMFEQQTKASMRDRGWTEVMTYSMISKKLLESCGFDPTHSLKVVNPLSSDFEYMRPSLFPGILQAISDNEHKREKLFLFELSKIYIPKKNTLPQEQTFLSGVCMEKKKEIDIYRDIKGVCEVLTREWFSDTIFTMRFVPLMEGHQFFDREKSVALFFHDKRIGFCGIPRQDVLTAMGIKTACAAFEIDLQTVLAHRSVSRVFVPIPKYPSAVRDVAFVSDITQSYEALMSAVRKINPLIVSVELFDVFESEKLGKGKRSLALHITYQSLERTLLAEEVDALHVCVRETLQKTFSAEMR
ncbi:phenylalanine--tRNA ligase subunit beta [Candidatus Uhrbacteria bacterium]|nr:phenylalanine--tRNA ligase subunit beta [Candidatus Uhrbacteria bacterium]